MLTCQRCTYTWEPRKGIAPKACPSCKAYTWNKATLTRYIYALQHPITKAYFYVGAGQSLRHRLSEHLRGNSNGPTMRQAIRAIKDAGLTPFVVILEEAPLTIAVEREQYWIDTLKAQGEPLLNKKPAKESAWLIRRTLAQTTDTNSPLPDRA